VIRAGDRAPDFEGETSQGSRVSLTALRERGPVVLYFYVKDFTPG
jgi:peroxiredoxin